MNLVDLDTFVRVADHGSLTGAARELGVPKSTVSRRVARLEDELGLALVHRTGRSISLTDRGEQLHIRSAPALRELAETERAILDLEKGPSGLLRITAPADLGTARAMVDLFVGYRRRYPAVRLEIYLSDRIVDLIGEGFDLALRPSGPRATWSGEGLMQRSLGYLEAGIFAAPSYLGERTPPSCPADLAHFDWVAHHAWVRSRELPLVHRETRAQAKLPVDPVVLTNHIDQVLGIISAGGGVAAVPKFLARPLVERGDLVALLEEWELPGGTLAAVWPTTRHLSPRIRSFLDYAVETLEVS